MRRITRYSRWRTRAVRLPRATGGVVLLASLGLLGALATFPPVIAAETGEHGASPVADLLIAQTGSDDDIISILDQDAPDAERAARNRARADAPPPAGASGRELMQFYFRRAGAAKDTGAIQQAIADLEKARELAEKHGGPTAAILRDLSSAHLVAGNLRDSLTIARQRWEAVRGGRRAGQKIAALRHLVRTSISTGHIREAKEALETMKRIEAKLPARVSRDRRMIIGSNIAEAEARFFALTGKMRKAEQSLVEAIEGSRRVLEIVGGNESRARGAQGRLSGLQRFRVNLLRRLGRLHEAEVLARDVLTNTLRQQGKYSPSTARSVLALQSIIFTRGRYAEAVALARSAVEIFETIGISAQSEILLRARLAVAKGLAAQEQWTDAAAIVDRVERDVAGDGALHDRTLGATLEAVLIRYRNGQTEAGLAEARRIYERRLKRFGDKHALTGEALGYRAIGVAATGDIEQALEDFRAAVLILLAKSRQVDSDDTVNEARELRRKAVFDGYMDVLTKVYEQRTDIETRFALAAEAFRIADAASGGTVKRAVAQSSTRAAARDPQLAQLVREEQDMLREIGALFSLLTAQQSAPPDQRDEDIAKELRVEIDRLRGRRAEVREEIEGRFPDYVRLVDPPPARLEQVRAAMADDESVLATYVTETTTYVWALGKSGPVGFTAAPIGRAQLGAAAIQLRRALDPGAAALDEIPDFDVGLAHRVYSALLAPVAAGWQPRRQLIVVADGPLGQLPFSLLPTEKTELGQDRALPFDRYQQVAWLARSHAVTVMPSVASLIALRALPETGGASRNFVGFGDPVFSADQVAEAPGGPATRLTSRGAFTLRGVPIHMRSLPRTQGVDSAEFAQLPRLPDTDPEIRAMARAMHADMARDVFIGKAANEDAVRQTKLDDYRVVAFATHGLVPGDLMGLEEPALALTAPQIAGITDSDGLLTMGEIFELDMAADWVVLSACNTGTADGAGAEAVSGLGRAFFYAGTRALLVSNWPVETTSARILTTDVFARQAAAPDLPRAEALRRARVALIDGPGFIDQQSGKAVFSYAHPIFWAPFTLIGDGGQVT